MVDTRFRKDHEALRRGGGNTRSPRPDQPGKPEHNTPPEASPGKHALLGHLTISHFISQKMPPHFVTKLPSLSHKPPPSFLQGAEGGPPSAVGTHITLQLSQCACQELKPWARTEHWEERHTKVERGPCVLTMRPHQNDHGRSGRLAAQARTPVLVRRARAAGPVPPCAFLFWLDLGVAAW